MDNITSMAVSMMYAKIENVTEPKEALEILAKSENDMGWCGVMGGDVMDIRFKAYGVWLYKYNREWFDYLKAINDFIGALGFGAVNIPSQEEPDGWIPPIPYLKGEVI